MTFPAILSATNKYGVSGAGAGHRNHRGMVRKKSPVRCGDLLCGGIRHRIFLSVVKYIKHIYLVKQNSFGI